MWVSKKTRARDSTIARIHSLSLFSASHLCFSWYIYEFQYLSPQTRRGNAAAKYTGSNLMTPPTDVDPISRNTHLPLSANSWTSARALLRHHLVHGAFLDLQKKLPIEWRWMHLVEFTHHRQKVPSWPGPINTSSTQTLKQSLSVFCHYRVAFPLLVFYEWNYTACAAMSSSTQHNAWNSSKLLHITVYNSFYCWWVFHCIDVSVYPFSCW